MTTRSELICGHHWRDLLEQLNGPRIVGQTVDSALAVVPIDIRRENGFVVGLTPRLLYVLDEYTRRAGNWYVGPRLEPAGNPLPPRRLADGLTLAEERRLARGLDCLTLAEQRRLAEECRAGHRVAR